MIFRAGLTKCRIGPTRRRAVFSPTRPELTAKRAFVPCCLSETEEVIYVLFGYGSLVWRIGSGAREFFEATHWVHLLYQIGHTISHTAVNVAGSELRGRLCNAVLPKHCFSLHLRTVCQ